ncbi:MAG: hypothetical protein IJ857_02625 [Lachnospiraceae bacterium]|nr:hypothetical protein [Lachnospiraceae bacterium]
MIKKRLLILIAAAALMITGGMDCSLRTVYAAEDLVDINVSSSGGKRHKHHDADKEKTEKEIEIELSRANIEAQEEALKLMQTVQTDQVSAIQNAGMLSAEQEAVEKEAGSKPEKSDASKKRSSKRSEEPKTAGSDLPIVPVALLLFLTDMLLAAVESAGDFDDYIRRGHIEKLVEKYKKGGRLTKIGARIEISLCMFYSRLKAGSDRNTKNRNKKCSAV